MIGSIVDYLYAPDDPEAVLDRMTDPATRIVSLTVTEGGYHKSASTGEFDDRDPAIQADIAADAGTPPRTTFGYVVEALRRRRDDGTGPFTVMSCDNIQGNGHVAHAMITAYARRKDPELADWIEENVPFPNSMVDRITPRTTDEDREELEAAHGHRRRLAGGLRAVHAVGARGPVRGRPPAVRGRRGAGRRRRRALRADEAAPAQREPPGHRLPRLPRRVPLRPRGGGRRALRRVHPRLHGPRGHADARAGARRRPRRLQGHAHRALREPGDPRHAGPAGRGELRPHPDLAGAGHPDQPARTAGRSSARRWSSPPGPATPRASTSRASRSRSSTPAAPRTASPPRAATPTSRSRSSPTATSSATWSTTSGSRARTGPTSTPCTSGEPGPR